MWWNGNWTCILICLIYVYVTVELDDQAVGEQQEQHEQQEDDGKLILTMLITWLRLRVGLVARVYFEYT